MDRDDTRRGNRLNDAEQDVGVGTPLFGRATPRIVDDVGRHRWVGVLVGEIGRRQEELVTLGVGRRRPVALVHVPAPDPAGARRHTDLIADTVVSDHRSHRVRPVAVIVAGLGRVGAADAAAGMNGIVPVVVVVTRRTPVFPDQRRVIPEVARVLTGDDDPGAVDPHRPCFGRSDEGDVPLDSQGCLDLRRSGVARHFIETNRRIGVDMEHVIPRRHLADQLEIASYPDHVGDPERPELDVGLPEPFDQRPLGSLGGFPEDPNDESALFGLGLQRPGAGEIRLLREKNQAFRRASGCLAQHPRIDLGRPRIAVDSKSHTH